MCLAIPGKIVDLLAEDRDLAVVDVLGVRRKVDLGPVAGRASRRRRLGSDSRRFRHEQDQRSRRAAIRCACLPTWAKAKPPWRRSRATASANLREPIAKPGRDGGRESGDRNAIRRRVSRTRIDRQDRRRDPPAGRPRAALSLHGGVRRAHALDLPLRPERPAAAEHRAGARPRLSGVRAAHGQNRRRALDGGAARRHLHRVRRHDARARDARQPARAQGARHGRAHRLFAVGRAEAGARKP